MNTRVIVGMSGGVDSSVAAYLLKREGYTVEGLFMKNWEQDDKDDFCSAALDLADATHVCNQLGIPLHAVNFSTEYWDRVFSHFLTEYEKGRTPNPDVLCNKEIKFNAFLNHAMTLGADFIATGHYAKVRADKGLGALYKSKDREKDQTYFLHAVSQEALAKTLFPLGNLLKSEVRSYAKELGLVTHDKKDSTGICFIGEKRFKAFLNEYLLAIPGDIKTTEGVCIGKHDGLMFYTLGQRQGLGIGGVKQGLEEPWYVVDKEIKSNTLVVAQGNNHPSLFSNGLLCGPIHWLIDEEVPLPLTCHAKIRYRQTEEACIISPLRDNQHCVMFSTPQRAVTEGQYIVFYEKNRCLGGATIEQRI